MKIHAGNTLLFYGLNNITLTVHRDAVWQSESTVRLTVCALRQEAHSAPYSLCTASRSTQCTVQSVHCVKKHTVHRTVCELRQEADHCLTCLLTTLAFVGKQSRKMRNRTLCLSTCNFTFQLSIKFADFDARCTTSCPQATALSHFLFRKVSNTKMDAQIKTSKQTPHSTNNGARGAS